MCADCPLRARCTTAKDGRSMSIHEHEALLRAARAQARTPEFKQAYPTRSTIERIVGWTATSPGRRIKLRYLGVEKNHAWLRIVAPQSISEPSSTAVWPAPTGHGHWPDHGGRAPCPLRHRTEPTRLDSGGRSDHVVGLKGPTHAAMTALSALLPPQFHPLFRALLEDAASSSSSSRSTRRASADRCTDQSYWRSLPICLRRAVSTVRAVRSFGGWGGVPWPPVWSGVLVVPCRRCNGFGTRSKLVVVGQPRRAASWTSCTREVRPSLV